MEEKTSSSSITRPRRLSRARTPSRVREMGSICKPRKRAAKPAEEDEAVDFDEPFMAKGWLDDEKECMWLSSGRMSPSSCLEDLRFSVLLDPTVNCWLVSMLLLLTNYSPSAAERTITCFFDGSRLNPIEEQIQMLREDDDDRAVLDDSSSPSKIETEAELDGILSGFPSPSCRSSWDSEVSSSSSSISVSSSSDEPILWPNDKRFEWGNWDSFIMSPRKPIVNALGLKQGHGSKLGGKMKTKFSGKIDSLEPSRDIEEEFATKAVVVPIESLLGLEEFDGREGLDSEFNKDDFSFVESV